MVDSETRKKVLIIMKVKFHLEKSRKPTVENGMKVAYGNAKRGGYYFRWYLILAVILSPIVFMLYTYLKEYVLITAPGVITTEPLMITASQKGIVQKIDVTDNEVVESNQLLLQIKAPVLEDEIAFLTQELMILNDSQQENDQLEGNLSPFYMAINNAKNNLAKVTEIKNNYDQYVKEGKVSQVDYAAIISIFDSAQSSLTNAYIALNQAKIEQKQRQLAGGITQVTRALNQNLTTKMGQLGELYIQSPYAGTVIEINTLEGERVDIGDLLVTIAPDVDPYIISYVDPKYIEKAQEGALVSVKLPNGKKIDGQVTQLLGLTSKLPTQLAKPFEGIKAQLKVKITFLETLPGNEWVEGMPIEVFFDLN